MFTYRPALPTDRQFVISGWSASLRMTRDIPFLTMADYADIMHSQIAKALEREGVRTIVAEGSVLAGFVTFEPDAQIVDDLATHRRGGVAVAGYVFYCYVAQPFRRRGIARALFDAAGIDPASRFHYACRTLSSFELRGKVPSAHYSPFYARFSPEENQHYAREHDRETSARKHRSKEVSRPEVFRRPPR
jgi:GNAT superfamily N-acetyltransferase